MAYTTPKTWGAGNALSATDLNTHVRDNIAALKSPPNAFYVAAGVPAYSTTSTSFVDVDGTNLALAITPASSQVMIWVTGSWAISVAPAQAYMTLAVNGTDIAPATGLATYNTTAITSFAIVYRAAAIANISNTYKLRYKVTANTLRVYNVNMLVIDLI